MSLVNNMRFGKRLALAMIKDAGEAPYISQKPLKHILVGLEKLAKAYAEQSNLHDQSSPPDEILRYANSERSKCGLPYSPSILDRSEIVSHDTQFVLLLDSDVSRIRTYVDNCEADLMEAINAWIEDATKAGLLIERGDGAAMDKGGICIVCPADVLTEFKSRLEDIVQEHERIFQYIVVNTAAIRKLVGRRNKNVPPCFWSVAQYRNAENMKSPDGDLLADAIQFLKASLPES